MVSFPGRRDPLVVAGDNVRSYCLTSSSVMNAFTTAAQMITPQVAELH